MKRFIIERNLPGAGNLTPEELQKISQTSCRVASMVGHGYQWVTSFVADDKVYCVHLAENEDYIREHSFKADLPINTIREVYNVIDPITAVKPCFSPGKTG